MSDALSRNDESGSYTCTGLPQGIERLAHDVAKKRNRGAKETIGS